MTDQQITPAEVGKTAIVDGLSTNYLEAGEGNADSVLLLHGAGPGVTSWANWRTNMPVFAERFRVVAPDAPGFGHTERRPGQQYSMDFWATHTVGLMDELGIDKADIVGNSFGGALTLAMAARFPERIGRFVLMGSGGLNFVPSEAVQLTSAYQPSIDKMRVIMRDCFAYDPSIVTDELIVSRYETSNLPGHEQCYTEIFAQIKASNMQLLTTPEEQIAQIPHEALVIHGREDKMVPLSCAVRFHELLANSELHVFGKCGHWTQIERQEAFDRMVIEFFER